MTKAALAVDAGQTTIRAALSDDGRGPRSAVAPGVIRVGIGWRARGGERAIARGGRGARPAAGGTACRGRRSGCPASRRWPTRTSAGSPTRSAEGVGVESLAIASDGLTALLGAIGRRDGVVVAAGTGTACLARRGRRFAKVDGWGSLLSDAGSGFAIGRAGLDAALREYDGRAGLGRRFWRRRGSASARWSSCPSRSTPRRCPRARWLHSRRTWGEPPRAATSTPARSSPTPPASWRSARAPRRGGCSSRGRRWSSRTRGACSGRVN